MDLLCCEILQVYLAAISKSLYIFKYDSQQSLLVEKCLDFPNYSSSLKIFIAYNFYRLYILGQSTKSIDAYTLQFTHLYTKQLPDNPTTMIIEYDFDLSWKNISFIRGFDDKTTLVFIGIKQDGENRLIFLNFGNENEAYEIR